MYRHYFNMLLQYAFMVKIFLKEKNIPMTSNDFLKTQLYYINSQLISMLTVSLTNGNKIELHAHLIFCVLFVCFLYYILKYWNIHVDGYCLCNLFQLIYFRFYFFSGLYLDISILTILKGKFLITFSFCFHLLMIQLAC
jgi:hypothetical protein